MGKRFNGEWKYYKFKKENETDETFKKTVKEVLSDSDVPLGTTDLWHRCLDCELLLSRETFLKRLRKLDDDWLQLDVVGSCYLWSVNEIKMRG